MDELKVKQYESPTTVKVQVEMEGTICVSRTGKKTVDESNNKVKISEQEHGAWDGSGDDINATFE